MTPVSAPDARRCGVTEGADSNLGLQRVVSPPISEINKLRTPLTAGELRVLDYFLEVLPRDWEIYVQPHLNGLRPDFVLLHPRNGIAVYEVKDWNPDSVEYFVRASTNGAPRLCGRHHGQTFSLETQNPVTKIALYKEEIFNLYCPGLPNREGFGCIVAGIIFPNMTTRQAEDLVEPLRTFYGVDRHPRLYPIVGSDLLEDRRTDTVRRYVLPSVNKIDQRMKGSAASDLRHWLVEPDFAAEQRRPLACELSARQKEIATNSERVAFRRVRGPAGSGKSLSLAARAARLAQEGKRVLVITFNITLINYLLDVAVRYAQSGKVRAQIEALNFHYWCKRVALASGHSDAYACLWQDGASRDVLERTLAEAATGWTRDLESSGRWDAILVDEGQDFRPAWWSALRSGLRQDGAGEMLLCADAAQNVYAVPSWTDIEMAGAGFRGKWFELDVSYRMPASLCTLARTFVEKFLPDTAGPRPTPPQGRFEFSTRLRWRQTDLATAASACVDALVETVAASSPPIAYADLVCIVEDEKVGRDVVTLLRARGINAIDTFGVGDCQIDIDRDSKRKKLRFYKGDARVKVTTVHSFKGWASKAVVVHISRANSPEALALAYAAISRARADDFGCYLTVVCSAPELAEYGRLWPSERGRPQSGVSRRPQKRSEQRGQPSIAAA